MLSIKRFNRVLVLIWVAILSMDASISIANVNDSKPSAIDEAYTRLYMIDIDKNISAVDKSRKIEKEYGESIGPIQKKFIKTTSDKDLDLLFRASLLVASVDDKYVSDLRADYSELYSRKLTASGHYDYSLYGALIQNRMLNEARNFSISQPGLKLGVPPDVSKDKSFNEKEPSYLSLAPNGKTLTLSSLDDFSKIRVIVTVGCHVSRDAVRSIQSDKLLRESFEKAHAIWLQPADPELSLDDIRNWNHEFPSETMSISYRNNEWPMIGSWDMPTFYFFNDGKLVSKVVGWYPDKSKDILLSVMREQKIVD